MDEKLRRTGVTDLNDTELLLFDIITTMGGTYRFFHPDVFPLQYNYPSHGLDEQTLTKTLDRFEVLGWTRGEDFIDQWSRPDRSIRISDVGARMWEAERKPDWSRYVTDWYGRTRRDTERHRVSIFGYSPTICCEFFDVSCDCGFFDYDGGRVVTAVGRRQLFYWRHEERVYFLSAWLNSWHSPTDWSYFEEKRTWWRFANEIGKLWELPRADS